VDIWVLLIGRGVNGALVDPVEVALSSRMARRNDCRLVDSQQFTGSFQAYSACFGFALTDDSLFLFG
jgi:hypothetical protein